MALFPLFIDLSGRKCVCVGGGNVAARKVKVLLEFGADITVISPETCKQLVELSSSDSIRIVEREYRTEDLEGAYLVIAATQDRQKNKQVHDDAIKRNILVNVADSPEECTFTFPSIVRREDLVIGITTSGSYPAFTKMIREKMESLFPDYYGDILRVLKEFRKKALHEISEPHRRKKIKEKMLNEVLRWGGNLTEELLLEKFNDIYKKFKYTYEEVYENEQSDKSRKPGKQTCHGSNSMGCE